MFLTIEEDVAEIDNDATPQKIRVIFKHDLTDADNIIDLIPPTPIRVIGTVKDMPIIQKKGTKSTNLDIIIEANNFELIEDSLQRIKFTKKDIEEFKKLSKDPLLLDKLRSSVAPHIAGHDKIKEAMLLFLVKGVAKQSKDKSIKTRDFFHLLLIGDPGAAKSEFGKEVNNLSFKSKIAVGKGASGVGLTASAEKDELIGERVLSAGTIPICNGGHVVIDEVDKMDDEVQSHLLDCMESGTINISKSRVQGQLKANVGVLMIANPKSGRFDKYNSIAGQINLSQPLISRFDLIFPIMDIPEENKDKELFTKILAKHKNIDCASERCIDFKMLRKYLFYVSKNVSPKLTDKAEAKLYNYFEKMRQNSSNGNKNTISITARQIESMLRISEAYSKLRMGKNVQGADVEKAINMVQFYLESLAYDKDTGKIDVDRIMTGISSRERNAYNNVNLIIAELEKQIGNVIPIEDVVKKAGEQEIPEELVESTLEKLRKDGDIYEPRRGFIQRFK